MAIDGEPILVPASDHGFWLGRAVNRKVVRNGRNYTDYAGDEYLNPGDEVVTMLVVE